MYPDIFQLTKREEANYQTLPIPIFDNWEWNMYKHVITTVAYKNSQYTSGDKENRPFKNIIRPILNVQYRAEGFDLKDIDIYVDDAKDYYKSFLIKKFHEKWGRVVHMDTFIDELVESYVDFGGALIKNVNKERPEVVPLQQIAFCDQTDMLSGPLGLKHFYAPDQLKLMEKKGWGKFGTTIDEVLTFAQNYKIGETTTATIARTPGKYIEVYEVHGMFPNSWLEDESSDADVKEDSIETEKSEFNFSRQVHIITYYQDGATTDGKGITLFRGKEKDSIFKVLKRDTIFGRALGLGGAEELFEPQVWLNYDVIRIKEMLDHASKIIHQTADQSYATRNTTEDMDNGTILIHELGKPLTQVDTQPVNITVFENSIKEWEAHAQQMGSANDAIMGINPNSGTPFKLQELVTQEGHSLHDYRRGKIATFVDEEVYMDWVIPFMSKEVTKDQKFMSELSLEELQAVVDNVVVNEANKLISEKMFSYTDSTIDPVTQEEIDFATEKVRKEFMRGGNKRFLEIVAGEMKDAPLVVKTNIANKQKDLSGRTDKMVNIMRQIIAAPQILQDPGMAKLFNQIIESSGFSPVDFSYLKPATPAPTQTTVTAEETTTPPPDGSVVDLTKQ